jgi:uncharacterized protein (TIGR03435 family)
MPHLTTRVFSAVYFAAGLIGWVGLSPAPAPAQTPAAPAESEFEVASVRQLAQSIAPGQNDLSFVGAAGKLAKITGNRVTLTGTLHTIIATAYGVKGYQITGAPSWADSLIFAITAKTTGESEPTQEQVRPMFQALLANRFQLKLHHDSKEVGVYRMTLAPGRKNTGLKPAAPDEKFNWDLTPGPGGTLRSKATKESVGDFVQLVGVSADRPVIDQTGLTGYIDYDILISPQEGRGPDDVNRAIIDAVKSQLGLKLDPAKEPMDLLVIDRVEKLTEN